MRSRILCGLLVLVTFAGGCRSRSSEPQTDATPRPLNAAATTATAAAATATAPAATTRAAIASDRREPAFDGVRLTTGNAPADARLPWIIGLHGLGDRPESFARFFRGLPFPAHVYVPRGLRPWHNGYDWFGVRVDGDPEALAEAVEGAAKRLASEIGEWSKAPHLVGKPVVTGFSQGGMLSFALALHHGNAIAAALPIAGMVPEPSWARAAPSPSVTLLAFHGDEDSVIPVAPTERTVARLREQGVPVTLFRYPKLGHHISTELVQDWSAALEKQLAAAATP